MGEMAEDAYNRALDELLDGEERDDWYDNGTCYAVRPRQPRPVTAPNADGFEIEG
jgi:hypothetical protein